MALFRQCFVRAGNCVVWAVDAIITIVGPVLAFLACCLIGFVVYAYFSEVLPQLYLDVGSPGAELWTLIGLWMLFNLFYNYITVLFTGPGTTPDNLSDDIIAQLIDDPELPAGSSYRYCKRCAKPKPMRAHHCSICNVCVLKMDHHCPWVNNCVGYRNLKFFLLFLIYMWGGSGFFLFVSADRVYAALVGTVSSTVFLMAAVLCFSAFVATSLFLAWNLYLVMTNQSTIEFYGNHFSRANQRFKSNPFNLGISRNLEEVFGQGTTLFTWWLPSRAGPSGDGLVFPMNDKARADAAGDGGGGSASWAYARRVKGVKAGFEDESSMQNAIDVLDL